jgi:uncharacterized protein with HEPN domain
MPRDPKAYLWDAQQAANLLGEFRAGKSFADYQAEAMLRSAVVQELLGDSSP